MPPSSAPPAPASRAPSHPASLLSRESAGTSLRPPDSGRSCTSDRNEVAILCYLPSLEHDRPYAGAMFAGTSVLFLLVYLVVPLLALLLLWLIIYSAVRAALTAHRRALAAERTTAPDTP